MPSFQLEKGSKFQLDKGIRKVTVELGWQEGDGVNMDLDGAVFLLVHLPGGKPIFYNDGSHAVFYGNVALKEANGSFVTPDKSIFYSGDNRTGASSGAAETFKIDLDALPKEGEEIAVWTAIYKARDRKQSFGMVKGSFLRILNDETGAPLCEYRLREDFRDATSVQVGSFVKLPTGQWEFEAIGNGSPVEIGDIVTKYS